MNSGHYNKTMKRPVTSLRPSPRYLRVALGLFIFLYASISIVIVLSSVVFEQLGFTGISQWMAMLYDRHIVLICLLSSIVVGFLALRRQRKSVRSRKVERTSGPR